MLLAACGGGGGAPAAQSTPAASPTPSPLPAFAPRTIDIELMPIAGSAYHGSARITTSAGGYKVSITLSGLTAGSKHLVNFHPGTCAAIDSGTGQDVGYLTADSSGQGTLETEYHSAYSIPSDGRVIAIHGDLGTAAAAGHYACGAMPA